MVATSRRSRGRPRLWHALLVAVLALFCAQTTLSYAATVACFCDDAGDCDDGRGDCACPFPCAPGCAGSLARALPAAPLSVVLSSPGSVELIALTHDRAPGSVEPRDILHVPKSPAA